MIELKKEKKQTKQNQREREREKKNQDRCPKPKFSFVGYHHWAILWLLWANGQGGRWNAGLCGTETSKPSIMEQCKSKRGSSIVFWDEITGRTPRRRQMAAVQVLIHGFGGRGSTSKSQESSFSPIRMCTRKTSLRSHWKGDYCWFHWVRGCHRKRWTLSAMPS